MSRLKDLRVILVIVLVISWVVAGFLFYNFKQTSDAQLANKDMEIQGLQDSLTQIGELVPAYTVNADVPSGKKVEESDLDLIEVPMSMSTNLVSDIDELVGKYYKLGLTAGTVITTDCLYEEQLTDDLRLFDVVTHTNPIGLEAGSFVDIRIQMPMGEDYIAIPHRKVMQINTGILKVAVTENDIHTYNSMLVDSIIYPGTQIYAVEYLEGGIQKPAESYYPSATNILAIAQKDPNLLTAIKEDMLVRRGILETGLNAAGVGLTEKEQEDIKKTIEKGKNNLIKIIENSQKGVEKERAEFEKQQLKGK